MSQFPLLIKAPKNKKKKKKDLYQIFDKKVSCGNHFDVFLSFLKS